MGLNGKLSENVYRQDGELSLGEMKRREDAWRDSQTIVTRCAFCPWSYTGPAGAGRDQSAAHRKAEHPKARRLTKTERSRAQEKAAVAQAARLRDTRDRRQNEKAAPVVASVPEKKPPAQRPPSKPVAAPKPKPSVQKGSVKRSRYGTTIEERRARVVTDIQELGRTLGHPPSSNDDTALAKRAQHIYGSWADAVEAAGFPRPHKGTSHRRPTPANYGLALAEIARLERLLRDARASRDQWKSLYRSTAPARALEHRWKAA